MQRFFSKKRNFLSIYIGFSCTPQELALFLPNLLILVGEKTAKTGKPTMFCR